jgi:anti-sigma factor RsiW
MKKEWTNLLIKSFDQELSAIEKKELEQALANSAALRAEKEALLNTRQLFASFSPKADNDFATKVLNRIEKKKPVIKKNLTFYLSHIYPKAVAACILILFSFIAFIYLSEGSLDSDALIGINDLSPDEAYSFLTDELD